MGIILDESGSPILDENGTPQDDGLPFNPREASDYANALLLLLPSGAAWPKEPDAVQPLIANALAGCYARMDRRAVELLIESPAGGSLIEMLPEWEATQGLPDPCIGQLPNLALRQAAVLARIRSVGGQSIATIELAAGALGYGLAPGDFDDLSAAQLGGGLTDDTGQPLTGDDGTFLYPDIPITISEFRPFQAGDTLPSLVYSEAWAFVWRVNAPPSPPWLQLALRCALQRISPAHTVIQLQFGVSTSAYVSSTPTLNFTAEDWATWLTVI